MADVALSLNAGSSSLRFALFRFDGPTEDCLASGAVEGLGAPSASATLRIGTREVERGCPGGDPASALSMAFRLLSEFALPPPSVVGHRIVHGGTAHRRPARIDTGLLASLRSLVPLAPLHLPKALLGIEAAMARLPAVPHVACFDTAFHADLPERAARFALPAHLYEEGVRRYGFHGLSYEYVLSTLGEPPPARVIIAHLGNGASLAAVRDGHSIDTTMGLTPSGGIMMGTRAGDLDPGLLLYLLREKGYSPATLEKLVDRESGLLGIAGTADMKLLVERQAHDERARLAIGMLGYEVRKAIGGYIAALGGLDALVFTGGIGEHVPEIREEACRGLEAFGIALHAAKNTRNETMIHAESSTSAVLVVATDEDRMIARHARAFL